MPWGYRRRAAICVVAFVGCLSAEVFEGQVVEDHSNRPLPSVQVRVRQAGKAGLVADLETNAAGRFSSPDLPSGEYQIEVSRRGYATSDFHLRLPAAAVNVRLVRFGAITGHVSDAKGRPTRGASVFPMIQTAEGFFRRLPMGDQADDRGQYRLFNLPPGRYAAAVSWASPRTGASGAYLYPNNSRPEIFAVTGGEEFSGVDFAMPRDAELSISGKVELSSAGTRAFVGLASVEQPSLAVSMKFTEPDGSFRLEGLLPGHYELLASAIGYAISGSGEKPAPQSLFGRMRVDVSHNMEGVTIALEKGRTVRIMLRAVADAADACPSKATIVLSPVLGFYLPGKRVEATTGEEATIENVPPSLYRVSAAELGDACFNKAHPILDLRAGDQDAPFTITMTAAAVIRGKLLAGAGQPEDFVVVLAAANSAEGPPQPLRLSRPGAEGTFAFSGLPPGRYWIAAKPAAEASSRRWMADPAQMTEIEVPSGLTELELPVAAGGN
jgi:hypothetical protein